MCVDSNILMKEPTGRQPYRPVDVRLLLPMHANIILHVILSFIFYLFYFVDIFHSFLYLLRYPYTCTPHVDLSCVHVYNYNQDTVG